MKPPILKRSGNVPKVLWFQDDGRIVLRIMLIDVKKYFLRVDLDHLRFSAIHDDKVYYLCLYFFGAIVPEKTINENFGREIRIQIIKAHKFLDWPRLQSSTEKISQIIPDPDQIVRESKIPLVNAVQWDDFGEYKMKNRLNILPAVPSSDEEESDDERYAVIADRF